MPLNGLGRDWDQERVWRPRSHRCRPWDRTIRRAGARTAAYCQERRRGLRHMKNPGIRVHGLGQGGPTLCASLRPSSVPDASERGFCARPHCCGNDDAVEHDGGRGLASSTHGGQHESVRDGSDGFGGNPRRSVPAPDGPIPNRAPRRPSDRAGAFDRVDQFDARAAASRSSAS